MIIGWYGLQSIEALIAGCSVICYIEKHLEKHLHKNSPIINANAFNLEEVLRNTILKYLEGYKENKVQNIEWARKYHSINNNNNTLLNSWNLK